MKNTITFSWITLILMLAWSHVQAGESTELDPELIAIKNLFSLSDSEIDIARARLTIERYFDPTVDIDGLLKQIDSMADEIKRVPLYRNDTEGKLNALIQYLYHPGSWNNQKPYRYDLDDPLGTAKPENKLVSNYLTTKEGNCVSMPILLLSLGERLGLDMSLSTAPLHFFVRLNDNGDIYNVEATAGGLKSDRSYIQEFDITFSAMRNKIYLQSLTKKQTLAAMLTGLGSFYLEKGDLKHAQQIGDMMLEHHPNYVSAMHLQGNIWSKRLHSEIEAVKKRRVRVTPEMRVRFDAILQHNLNWFEKAESLGWKEPPSDYDGRYLKMIEEAKKGL